MFNDDIAISVKGVSKDFALPHERVDSVKSLFAHPLRRRGVTTQHALKGISFDIKKGEFFGIVGRNGSGKSTLLKIIAGIYQPNQGTVSVNGRLVPFIELGVGFNPELSGRENVYLNGALMGFSPSEIKSKYQSIVDFAEIEKFMDQKLKNYSSGMQVRLAFSVATILAESDILLIDEVLAVGDADFQRKCFEYFKMLKRNKKTVIFVSHDMNAITEYCDRAVLIDKSKIVFSGTAADTAKEYTRLFLPELYMADKKIANDLYHQLHKDNSKGKWGIGGVEISDLVTSRDFYDNKDKHVIISFRVEAVGDFADEIVPGITIKDEKGNLICGTNSKISDSRKKIFLGKEPLHFSWTVPNIFNEGRFYIEPAVISATTNETLQWWNDAAMFRVTNEYKTPYIVAPRITLTTE